MAGCPFRSGHAARPTPGIPHAARAGCPHPQPEEHRPRHPEARAGGDHRAVGFGQVEPCLRHPVRRRAAALCREPVGLRAPVPAADGQARRRRDRGPVARDRDRAEGHQPQPALDRRHHHRDPRLPASAVRARRHALLPGPRPAAGGAEHRADGGRGDGAARGHQARGAGAGRARPQGRVRRTLRRHAGAGLCAFSRRRAGGRSRRAAQAEEDREARHRRRDRPSQGSRRSAAAAGRELRGGDAHRRRAGDRARTRRRPRASVFQQVRLSRLQLLAARTRAAPVLVQLTGGRLPELRWPGPGDGVRRRARGGLPLAQPGQRRDQGLGPAQQLHLRPAGKCGPALCLRPRHAVRATGQDASAGAAARQRHDRTALRLHSRGRGRQATPGQALAPLRRCPAHLGAPLARDRLGRGARGSGALPVAQALPGLRPARGCGARHAMCSCRGPTRPCAAWRSSKPSA